MTEATWIFGYGSLVFRPDFPFQRAEPAVVAGYARRFWQGSPDHRGTPEAPGRVVTLVPAEGERVWGLAYEVDPAHCDSVLAGLDHREREGYVRDTVALARPDGSRLTERALVYLATSDNAQWLGPASEEVIAMEIAARRGPSGENRDYALRLAEALRAMGADDPHVFAVERALRRAG
jgi:cation transport regulator ChaC